MHNLQLQHDTDELSFPFLSNIEAPKERNSTAVHDSYGFVHLHEHSLLWNIRLFLFTLQIIFELIVFVLYIAS